SSICLFSSPSFRGIQKYGEHKRLNQRHFVALVMLWSRHILVSFVMAHVPVECAVESHFHSYPNFRSKNRGTQNSELLHNGL
ncbi:unnamed protein product, partial [Callosobruchus maculatus]